jgi:hypothetical protein
LQDAAGGTALDFSYRADSVLSRVSAFGKTYDFGYADNGLLQTRSNAWRTWSADQRDGRGRLKQTTTAALGASLLVEAMAWRTNSTLSQYVADRTGAGSWDETRNYTYNTRGQLISETLSPSGGASATLTNTYDVNKLGVRTAGAV